jgi:hypothetical protein
VKAKAQMQPTISIHGESAGGYGLSALALDPIVVPWGAASRKMKVGRDMGSKVTGLGIVCHRQQWPMVKGGVGWEGRGCGDKLAAKWGTVKQWNGDGSPRAERVHIQGQYVASLLAV